MKKLQKLKYISISTRISILLGIIILLTMGLFSTFSIIKQKDDAITSINNNTNQLSQTIEKILRVSMLKNRRGEISLALHNIIGNEGIESARILNHQGVIKYSSQPSELDKNISHNNPLCKSCHDEKHNLHEKGLENFNHYRIDEKTKLIYNSLPIFNAPECNSGGCHFTNGEVTTDSLTQSSVHEPSQTILGFIEIEVSLKEVISNLNKTRNLLIFLTVLFALLASVITYFSIRYLVGKPVNNLVEGTKRVALGDFEHEIPPGKAELGFLAESFNKMQHQLLATQTQLIESEKLASVGKLANEIANEINNPLTGIIIYSESLIGNNNKDLKGEFEIIRQEALRIRESVRNILSLTRHEKPDFKMVDIGNVMNQAVSIVKKFSNFRNIKIISAIPDTLPQIPADSTLMEQVFLNLLLISSESMLTGGILNISVSFLEEDKKMEILFSDTGKGIPENVLRKIFAPEQTSELNSFEKTAISLSVCRDIIRMHRGEINISSTDSGTSVTIILPS
jgi:two-component system NtrC family sensor kinase